MKTSNNYAVFILSHGRPDKVLTYHTLRRQGYTGNIYIIVDDEDKSLQQYKDLYAEQVIVFSKKKYEGAFDIMDNFDNNKVIVYARNACYDIARDLALDYFFEYEDDYTQLQYRFAEGKALRGKAANKLDQLFAAMIDCLSRTRIDTIAFAQGGDFIGGIGSLKNNTYKRKAMNTFLFRVNADSHDDIKFIGRMNDDVNTYLTLGKVGKLFFQITKISLVQLTTQTNSGGNTDIYKKYGTYVKSFYSVIAAPSCCKISVIGTANQRIHHSINWKNAVPKIVAETHKKK